MRGRVSAAAGRDEPLRALDYLFLSAEPVIIPTDVPQIVISSPVKTCKETAKAVSLFGQRLIDAGPMGHLTSADNVCPWSCCFGSSRPAILVIPDLDRACEYVEEAGEQVSLTVVDATSHNAGRTASLARLGSLGARVLVVTSQADTDVSLSEEADTTMWEWKKEDFDSLLSEKVPPSTNNQAGRVRRYETEVVRALSADVDVVRVHANGGAEALEAVRDLEKLVEARGDEVPPELEKTLDLSFIVLTQLLRCPFRLADHPRLLADLAGKLDSIGGTIPVNTFLTVQEMQAVKQVEERFRALCDRLRRDNPKADALSQISSSAGSVTVFCGDTDLLEAVDGLVVRPVITALDLIPCEPGTAYAMPGWFGQGTMAQLLWPPFASPLRLILYEVETEWYRAFQRQLQQKITARRGRCSRSRVFPSILGWPEPKEEPEDKVSDSESSIVRKTVEDPFESWQSRYLSHRRRRLTASAQPSSGDEAVEARLVLFDGGHAFLTDRYRTKIATHLLESLNDDGEAELKLVSAPQLQRGDLVLFLGEPIET